MSVSIGFVLVPIFLIGIAFGLGIIDFSPQATSIFVQSLHNSKEEIIDLVQGKTTINESFNETKAEIKEATIENNKKLDNLIKYAQNKVNPLQVKENKPEFDVKRIELLVHEFTNQERKKYGLSQLAFDSEILLIARGHSQDMASRVYFSHETPEGLTPSDRATQSGYSCQKIVGLLIYSGIAENIFQGYLYDSYYTINGEITSYDWSTEEKIARVTVDGWMNSPGHRENILTEIFDREGIGVEITNDYKVYVTQNFC